MNKWRLALGVTGVGFYLGGAIVLGVLAGRWLDGRLSTEPAWMIVGLLLGLVVAFCGVWKLLLPFIGKRQDKEDS